jgi:type II secretory pathway pseudopilin PulG
MPGRGLQTMKSNNRATLEDGFTLMELLVVLVILIPVLGAVVGVFSVAVNQHASEQSSIEANQDARGGLEMMTLEIAQAGAHGDRSTATTFAMAASTVEQAASVTSSSGFTIGDYADVGTGAENEIVKVTAVNTGSISGIFRVGHAAGAPVRLFAQPYLTGVISSAGLGADSSATTTRLKIFGDMNDDADVYYVEYDYDSANAQITRSITPITQANLNPSLPLVRNVKPNSVQFTLYTDSQSVVTSVGLSFTVQNTWITGTKNQETELSSRIGIPSAMAASALLKELQKYGGVNRLPPTPSRVTTWSNR